jgi:hypothetical protein
VKVLSSVFKEENGYSARADLVENNGVYKMMIYDQNDQFVTEEVFAGKSIHYAKDAIENWARGLKVLNG